jgi:hypothetical protein
MDAVLGVLQVAEMPNYGALGAEHLDFDDIQTLSRLCCALCIGASMQRQLPPQTTGCPRCMYSSEERAYSTDM